VRDPLGVEETVMLFESGTAVEEPARSRATARALGYTETQWRTLCALRRHYCVWGDWYSRREVRRMEFAQWLYITDRLQR
jgi:hypothetical protein